MRHALLALVLLVPLSALAQKPADDEEKEFLRKRWEKMLFDPNTIDPFTPARNLAAIPGNEKLLARSLAFRLKLREEKAAALAKAKTPKDKAALEREVYRAREAAIHCAGVLATASLKDKRPDLIPDDAIPCMAACLSLSNSVGHHQTAIIQALGSLGVRGKPARPALEKLQDHADEGIAKLAFRALKQIDEKK